MFKVWHIVLPFVVLWITVVICEDCLYTNRVWGHEDPHLICYCDPTINQTDCVNCPDGKGFVDNGTFSGCIEWENWNNNCINTTNASTLTCNEENFSQLQAAGDPSNFYMCLELCAAPVPLQCASTSGFYNRNGYLGCFVWVLWRNITGCLN